MATRILLADDHRLFREGLRAMLELQPDIHIVAEADNGRVAVQMAHEYSPDIIVMDISMPELNGIEATRRITSEIPDARVIILSMHTEKRIALEVFKAGALGYVIKTCPLDELLAAINAVMQNGMYITPQLATILMRDYLTGVHTDRSSAYSMLTPREREVLQLLAEGHTSKEIAAQLGISVKTTETYRQQLMDKLELHSIAELTKYAIREGITIL